ncbi:MAG: hypothetical protein ACJ8R9_20605 [Steroidobacteraceae bacterium]
MRDLDSALLWAAAAAILAVWPIAGADQPTAQRQLSFDVREGRNLNSFLRSGPVAAHLVLRSGQDPRILVAFPAGNSGVGLWFSHSGGPITWTLLKQPQPLVVKDEKGRSLYGLLAQASATGADLVVKQAVLSSVRVLRDYEVLGKVPPEVAIGALTQGATVTWARDRLDGAAGYRLSLEVTHGEWRDGSIKAGVDGRITVKIVASSGETPLTPLAGTLLLNERARPDCGARGALAFLSYREKFLAGSWRFNTYFGRDTLMSLELLMPALTPAAVEAGLNAVLARLSPQGEVAHEEDIGEFAILEHLRAGGSRSDAPAFDYKMIDATFMLAPLARTWLLDDERGRRRATVFLAHRDGRNAATERTAGIDLVANLRFVIQSAAPFAQTPELQHLIGLKDDLAVGQWRDSNDGLGGGHYPYDVNAVLVPAALEAASRLYAAGLLDPYLSGDDRGLFSRAKDMGRVWRAKAPTFFEVSEPNEAARRAVKAYAAKLAVSADSALTSMGKAPVRYHALALKPDGTPVRVVHSDEGFALLFGNPGDMELDEAVSAIMRPFPAGLLTDAGIVVANPVFASPDVQARFSNHAYHGTVVWSWQQAMLAEALDRQLHRRDLAASVLKELGDAQQRLWRVIDAGAAMRNSELWSWNYEAGKFRVAPFGASGADADESNAAQLWSTVYLGIPRPGEPGVFQKVQCTSQ